MEKEQKEIFLSFLEEKDLEFYLDPEDPESEESLENALEVVRKSYPQEWEKFTVKHTPLCRSYIKKKKGNISALVWGNLSQHCEITPESLQLFYQPISQEFAPGGNKRALTDNKLPAEIAEKAEIILAEEAIERFPKKFVIGEEGPIRAAWNLHYWKLKKKEKIVIFPSSLSNYLIE